MCPHGQAAGAPRSVVVDSAEELRGWDTGASGIERAGRVAAAAAAVSAGGSGDVRKRGGGRNLRRGGGAGGMGEILRKFDGWGCGGTNKF